MASSSTSSSSNPLTTDDVLDEIERLDQNITRTMQEIDQSFSDCQIIVSSKILPQIDRFAESSREVWEHARLWINFFEAATAPSTPAVGRRAQAIRNARNRQQAAMATSAGASNTQGITTAALSESTTPDYNQSDDLSSSTNRRRISSINLASSRLSPDFLDGSPLGSLPPTPTPLGSSRNRLRQGAHIAPPAKIQWPSKDGQGNATPTRQPYDYQGELDRGSTTPTITLRDRPMSLSSYTQKANTTTATTTTPTRGNVSGGFQELDVHEDHQDVITPPTTLQFSVPESKMATTPRSVLAKSRVNKIQMKDGLVIPQPIFVNDDEDVEDPAFVARYTGRGSDEADIGGSKKRGREGDFLDQEDHPAHGRSWASLTEQQRNKERLLKSPRKMASVQDFFAVPSSTARSQNQERGDDSEERPQSPSLEVESQRTVRDAEDEDGVDPLLAALATPPEIRRGIQEYKARASLLPQRPAPPAWIFPTTTSSASIAAVTTTVTTTSAPMSSAPTVTFSSMPPPSSSSTVSVSTVTAAVSTSASGAAAMSTPVSTSGAMNPPARASNDNSIDSLFRQSLSSGFEATSNRRQTIATPTDLSRGPYGHPGAFSSRGGSGRNSIGGSTFRSALTSAPFSTPNPAGSVNGRVSLLGSALRKPLYPTSPSPASRAAASAIAAAAAASNSSKATSSAQQQSPPPPSPRRTNGLARPSMPAGMAAYSAGGSARMASTPANMLSQKQSQGAGTTPSFTPGQSNTHLNHTGDYSGAFSTPFSRNPPPAPRLGYHSDTLMTQSSLGLNHDGFGGYDSEDRTRMTMASASSSGLGGGGGRRVGDGMSSAGRHTSATSDSGPFTEEEEDETGDGDDDDVTGSSMRSPCPPGRTFYGSTTDLKSVAQATASNPSLASKAASSSLASQQQHRRF